MKGVKRWSLFLLSLSLGMISSEVVRADSTTIETSTNESVTVSDEAQEIGTSATQNILTTTASTSSSEVNDVEQPKQKSAKLSSVTVVKKQKKEENTKAYYADGRYVKITNRYYNTWNNFNWVKRSSSASLFGKTFQARGRYEFSNGATYYSLFDNQGRWFGYLNSTATQNTTGQGHYLSDGRLVKINKKGWSLYNGFNWTYRGSSTDLYGQTLKARGRYEHFNGATYYSLYDRKGVWKGYLNAGATINTTDQGTYFSDNRYVKIHKKGYGVWNNFKWQRRGNSTSLYGKTLHVRARYEFFNGATYYSLYDNQGKWQGYLNASATIPSNANASETKPTEFTQELLRLVNDERKKRKLSQVQFSTPLLKAAEIRANEITKVFDHTRPNGKEYHTILDEVTPGVNYLTSSENIAYSTSRYSQKEDAQQLFRIWMDSPGHKKNILTPNHRFCGFAAKKSGSRTYGVQLFSAGTF
ncbi:CAP domain-containing protein [Vagococcus sp.]|uniref:CAP domain-containing protein n=1 Tax=Vagococcus sp. TaxID=1933889 RepID=UPI003F9947F2